MRLLLQQACTILKDHRSILQQWNSPFQSKSNLISSSAPAFKSEVDQLFANTTAKLDHCQMITILSNYFFDRRNTTRTSTFLSSSENLLLLDFQKQFSVMFPCECDHRVHSVISANNNHTNNNASSTINQQNNIIIDTEVPFSIHHRSSNFRSDKKERQFRRIASVLRKLKRSSSVESVIDVGGGTGTLGEILSSDFGVSTCVLEKDAKLVNKGRKMFSSSSQSTRILLRRFEHSVDIEKHLSLSLISSKSNNHHLDNNNNNNNRMTTMSSSCCLCGVHACGSLSDAVLMNALRDEKAKSFMIVPCCHHKKLVQKNSDDDDDDKLMTEERNFLFFSETARATLVDGENENYEKHHYHGSFFNNYQLLRLANLNHDLTREQFHKVISDYLYHHLLIELFKKEPELFKRLLQTSDIDSTASLSQMISQINQMKKKKRLSNRHINKRNKKSDDDVYEDHEEHFASVMPVAHDETQSTSFSDYVAEFARGFDKLRHRKDEERQVVVMTEEDRKLIDAFCDSHVSSKSSSSLIEIFSLLHHKCVVESLGCVLESAMFLDRAVLLQEDQKRNWDTKWDSVVCASLFSSSTTPRRLALWGQKKAPVLMLE